MTTATVRILLTPGQPVLVGLPLPPDGRAAETLGLRLAVAGAGFADGARLLILAAEGDRVLAAFTPFGPAPPTGVRQYDLILAGPRLAALRTGDGVRLRLLSVTGRGTEAARGAGADLTVDLTLLSPPIMMTAGATVEKTSPSTDHFLIITRRPGATSPRSPGPGSGRSRPAAAAGTPDCHRTGWSARGVRDHRPRHRRRTARRCHGPSRAVPA